MMKATIEKPMILKAAATLANGGYKGSALQFERQGGKLRICGTNGYVMVLSLVDAKFTRWSDGEGFRFAGSDVQALMRGISKALKKASSVTIEVLKGSACVTLEVEGAAVATSFKYEKPLAAINLSGVEDACKQSPEQMPLSVAMYFMALASNAMRTISDTKHSPWKVKDHGNSRPLEFVSEEEPARVLVMTNKD